MAAKQNVKFTTFCFAIAIVEILYINLLYMNKIPSWVYIGGVLVLSMVFLVVLVVSNKNKLNAQERELVDLAANLGLDKTQFEADLKSQEVKDIVDADKKEGLARIGGSASTPSIFINGEQYTGQRNFASLSNVIESVIEEAGDESVVVLEAYTDYNCPHCAEFEAVVIELNEVFGASLTVDNKHMPFLKDSSYIYAYAAEAARKQDKFEEYSKELYLKTNRAAFEAVESTL